MSEIKFPKLRDDGSFVVFVRFATTDPRTVSLVQDYVKAWVKTNRTWTRIWRSDIIREERLELNDDFLSDPRVDVGSERPGFSIVLEGRPGTKRWKDWAMFLVNDIGKIFPEIKFERFDS